MSNIQAILHELESTSSAAGTLNSEQAAQFQQQILHEIDTLTNTLSARDMMRSDIWFRPQEKELLRVYLSRAFYARCSAVRPVYNHLMIFSSGKEFPSAQLFALKLSNAAAEFFQEAAHNYVRTISEEQFLSCWDADLRARLLDSLGPCRIILIPDFKAINLERFESALESIGIGRYSVVLCASEDTAAELQEYSSRDYRLSRYLLRHTYHYTENTGRDAYEFVCRQLEAGGLRLTDEFCTKLETYVQAVYPEASLKGAAFVRDLLIRIEDTRAEALRFTGILTAEDVPYSRKAELLEQAIQTAQQTAEPAPEEPLTAELSHKSVESAALEITNEAFAKLALEADGGPIPLHVEAKRLDNRPTNVLFLAMSTFPGQGISRVLQRTPFADKDYSQENREYYGRGQLDPIPKKIARDLSIAGQALDYIVLLCTPQVKMTVPELIILEDANTYSIENISAVQFFKAQIEPYLNPDTSSHFIEVDVTDSLAKAIENAVRMIRELATASKAPANQPKVNLYIDIHGGLRNTQMITQSVISLLETDKNKVNTQLYTVVNGPSQKYITQSDEAMRVQSFVSGITEILNYGRTGSLHRYFGSTQSDSVQQTMDCLDTIADGISWCNVNQYEQGLNQLSGKLMRLREEAAATDGASFLPLFEENIRNGFSGLLTPKRTVLDEIRWCLDKGFYQQALALIEAKIPDLFCNEGIFLPDENAYTYRGEPIKRSIQFNSCVFFVGTCGTNDSRNSPIKNHFYHSSTDNAITEDEYKAHLHGLQEVRDSLSLRDRMKTECSPQELAEDSELNVDFDPAIPNEELFAFLLLHHVLKDLRNASMHTKQFKYSVSRLKMALPYYLEICETILRAKRAPKPPVPEKKAGDQCTARVEEYCASSKKYRLLLDDGTPAIISRQTLKGGKELKIGTTVRVKITAKGPYAKECILLDEGFCQAEKKKKDSVAESKPSMNHSVAKQVKKALKPQIIKCYYSGKSNSDKTYYVRFDKDLHDSRSGSIIKSAIPIRLLPIFESMKDGDIIYAHIPVSADYDSHNNPYLYIDEADYQSTEKQDKKDNNKR